MTAIVGVLCRDGLVIGADSSATFTAGQFKAVEQPTVKISIIAGRVIVAGTGSAGPLQRFCHIIDTTHQNKGFSGHNLAITKELARATIEDFGHTYMKPGQLGAIVGFPLGDVAHLCEFAVDNFQPEFKDRNTWFVSMGSGQPITDPFLALMREVFWENTGPPTVQDGTFAVTWALQHAIRVNPGGINGPIHVAVMERDKGKYAARMLDSDDLQEHLDNIEAAKERLRTWPAAQSQVDAPPPPERQ